MFWKHLKYLTLILYFVNRSPVFEKKEHSTADASYKYCCTHVSLHTSFKFIYGLNTFNLNKVKTYLS